MAKRKAVACWLLLLLSKQSWSCQGQSPPRNGTIWESSECLALCLGAGMGTSGMASEQGSLSRAAEALPGYRLKELFYCPFNL